MLWPWPAANGLGHAEPATDSEIDSRLSDTGTRLL